MLLLFLTVEALLSFQIGNGVLWVLRWQNDAEGPGVNVNLAVVLVAALVAGVVRAVLAKQVKT